MPYAAQTHIDQALTNLSIAYTNDGYVADKVLPPMPVSNRSDKYFIYGLEQFNVRDDLVRPGSTAPEWERTLQIGFYNAERHAQRQMVTDDERRESDSPLQPDADTTEFLTDGVMNNREFTVLAAVTNTSNVTQNTALGVGTQWSDYVNSTPLTNLRAAKVGVRNGVLKEANSLTLSFEGALMLADHPSIKDLIKYTDPNNISSSGLPRVLRGLVVNESAVYKNTANDGQTPSLSVAIGANVLVHYTNPNAGLKTISFGYVFEAPDATTGVRGFATQKYREEPRHGDWIEVSTTYAPVFVAPLGAYLFTSAYVP